MRSLAREDPLLLIGWPLPLNFGLDGRLLLARRWQVFVELIIVIISATRWPWRPRARRPTCAVRKRAATDSFLLRRARLTSSATSSRSSRRHRRRRRRSLRRSEIAPVVCESLGLNLSARSGRGWRSPVRSPRSRVMCACWASGFPYSPKEDHGRLVSSSRLYCRLVCGCICALDIPGAGCPRWDSNPPPNVVEPALLLARDVQSAVPYLRSSVLLHASRRRSQCAVCCFLWIGSGVIQFP